MSLIPIVSTFSEAGRSLIVVSWKGDGKALEESSLGKVGLDSGCFSLGFGLTRDGVVSKRSGSSSVRSMKSHELARRLFFLVLCLSLGSILVGALLLAVVVEAEWELEERRIGGDIS